MRPAPAIRVPRAPQPPMTARNALEVAAARLRCPHCGASLSLADRALRCPHGHSYDVARDGHVSLAAPRRRLPAGDSAAMVAARDAFLSAGHYAPITHAIAAIARESGGAPSDRPGYVVDLGAGTGYYLAGLLAERPTWWGLALDASRPALRRAVRAHPRIAVVACDLWQPLPLRDGAADLALDVFAPRNGAEIARGLSARGALIVVTPTPDHLRELVGALAILNVDLDKPARLHRTLSPHLQPVHRRRVEFELWLDHQDIGSLVGMGPSAHHVTPDEVRQRLSRLPDPALITASVIVETFRR